MRHLKIFLFIVLLFSSSTKLVAQYISVDDTYSAQQLVENVLINSPCANVSNFSVSGGNFGTGQNSYGYFNSGSSGFPFQEGIVLSTCKAISTQGPNSYILSESAGGWGGDSDLQNALNINNTSNATILEFDFTPLTSFVSFDYIFSSEEYHGTAPCVYSDGFAFLLKEVGTSTYQNLALIPGTSTPVKVTTVHPDISGACSAQNPSYFGSYNAVNSPTNFNGQTVVMTASSNVTPGVTYHIKLVIADETNPQYDSAIFLGANSFNIGVNLGPDRLFATNNPVCFGETVSLDATVSGTNSYQWYQDGNLIPGAINPIYNASVAGVYSVEVTLNATTCLASGQITLEYTTPVVLAPQTLVQCDPNGDGVASFNLNTIIPILVGNSQNHVTFFLSLTDAQLNQNQIANPDNFSNLNNNQIYAEISNDYGCYDYVQINLVVSNNSVVFQNPVQFCDDDLDGITTIDFDNDISSTLLTGIPSGLVVSYYVSENDALLGINSLPNLFTNTIAFQQTVYAKIENGADCYGIIPIVIKVNTFNPPNFEDEIQFLCEGNPITLEVATNFSSYLWNSGETVNSLSVSTAGHYSVTVTDANGCEKTKNFTVTSSEAATINSINITDFNGGNDSIEIIATGNGNYEYSINGVQYQDNPIFTNIFPDEYTIFVRDKNGCGIVSQVIYVLDYPKYFTPNGDGYNDIWFIKNFENRPKVVITIFDRFGKLIYRFNGNQTGWNGKLNQNEMFSTDYWFTILLENGKIIKGNFSLKR